MNVAVSILNVAANKRSVAARRMNVAARQMKIAGCGNICHILQSVLPLLILIPWGSFLHHLIRFLTCVDFLRDDGSEKETTFCLGSAKTQCRDAQSEASRFYPSDNVPISMSLIG